MGARGNISMTAADVKAHAARTGVPLPTGFESDKNAITMPQLSAPKLGHQMNKTEYAYSLILDAQLRKGEIVEWRYQGIRLPWGQDPQTGIWMHYKPDFYVVTAAVRGRMFQDCIYTKDADEHAPMFLSIELHEVKGAKIWDRDKVRFKGCRAEWPMFTFKMMQKKEGIWQQVH